MSLVETKFIVGEYKKEVLLHFEGSRIWLSFGYNKKLIEEIKQMEGARWHGFDEPRPIKKWSIKNSARNRFQIAYLEGKNPYSSYDKPLLDYQSKRPLYQHQLDMVRCGITYHCVILGCEMGTGKTLAAIEILEYVKNTVGLRDEDVWYIGPKSGVFAVGRELVKWNSLVKPRMFTYEGLVKEMESFNQSTDVPPFILILDESSKIKTPTAQRSQAAYNLSELMRLAHKGNCYIILMSGTPAPKTPVDWWNQCISKDTWIMTSNGPRQVFELIKQSFYAVVNNSKYFSKGFFKTGTKRLYTIETVEGYTINATTDHKLLINFDGLQYWKELDSLQVGDQIILNKPNICWDGPGTIQEGYLLGLLIGDGNIYKNKNCKNNFAKISLFPDDISIVQTVLDCFPLEPNITGCIDIRLDIHDHYITKLVREYHLDSTKLLPNILLQTSSEFQSGFLRGLFDSDGTVERNRLRISFSQTDEKRIRFVQLMLMNFGIKSKLIKHRSTGKEQIGNRKLNTQDSFRLNIDNEAAIIFASRIGFINQEKRKILNQGIKNRHYWQENHTATVLNITVLKDEDVYDCLIEHPCHTFAANGFLVHNCEVACPGFLKEGNIHKFKARLCVIEGRQSITGGVYPHIVTWLDDPSKCRLCGQLKDAQVHQVWYRPEEIIGLANTHRRDIEAASKNEFFTPEALEDLKSKTNQERLKAEQELALSRKFHEFTPSKNEVEYLYKRMKGLVLVKFKKDCLDLPEKQYRIIEITPPPDLLRAAKLIKSKTTRAIQALTLMRELSDGFQYTDKKTGEEVCNLCKGTGKITTSINASGSENADIFAPTSTIKKDDFTVGEVTCDSCGGIGRVPVFERATDAVSSPKDKMFIDLLDEHEDIGRFIVWGGFTGTIDRLVDMAHKYGWGVLRVDGRGFIGLSAQKESLPPEELLDAMDLSNPKYKEYLEKYPKLCFVGHPQAGGMALTLTASPTELFYSNCFNGEARMQAEDRFHRAGMDTNRGATIIDLILLPTDRLVLDNLKKKKKLQNLTMGELEKAMEIGDSDEPRIKG